MLSTALILAGAYLWSTRGPTLALISGRSPDAVVVQPAINMNDLRGSLSSSGMSGLEFQSPRKAVIIRAKKTDLTQDELSAKVLGIFERKFPQQQVNVKGWNT